MIETVYHEVKPFPHDYCKGCSLNGCYPWNRHPFLLCSEMGGMHIVLHEADQCLSRKEVDSDAWNTWFKDLKEESQLNENIRLKAMSGKAQSSQVLPAEYAIKSLQIDRSLVPCLRAIGNSKRLHLAQYCLHPRKATEIVLNLRINPNTFKFHFEVLASHNLLKKIDRGVYQTTMLGKVVLSFCDFWGHILGETGK